MLNPYKDALSVDPTMPRELAEAEVVLKTRQGEYLVGKFDSVNEALGYLLRFQIDRRDIGPI